MVESTSEPQATPQVIRVASSAANVEVRRGVRDVRISIVIPAYNEAKNLPHVLPRIPHWVHEVILINDHSSDDTPEVATRLLPSIRIVNNDGAPGKGAALRAGFAAVTGDIIVMIDADGSSDPQEIRHFVEALLTGAYFAVGTRFAYGGGSADITHLRRFGARALIGIANQLFRVHLTDMFCGMNALWKDCFYYFDVTCGGFDVETLLILRVCKANLAIAQVPCFEHARIYGRSNFRTLRDGWGVLKMIVRERLNGRSVIRAARVQYRHQETNLALDAVAVNQPIGAAV